MLFWPHDHGILTPHPCYFDFLPTVGWSPYPWYFDPYPWYVEPDNHGILTPYPSYIEPSNQSILTPTHGISTPYPWLFDPLTHGISNTLSMVFWPPMHGISNIDASYQVSVHFAEGFQGTICECEKLADDGRRTPSDGKRSHCLWQGELKSILPDWLKNKHSTNKNRQHTFWRHWVSCFYCVLPMNNKYKCFKEPSNEHFYRAWFQMA